MVWSQFWSHFGGLCATPRTVPEVEAIGTVPVIIRSNVSSPVNGLRSLSFFEGRDINGQAHAHKESGKGLGEVLSIRREKAQPVSHSYLTADKTQR